MASFRTKSERVFVTDDGIRVESGLLVQARRYWEGSKALFVLVYGLGSAVVLLYGVDYLRAGDWDAVFTGLGVAIGGYLALYGYYHLYRGYSTDDRIRLDEIDRVTASEEWGNPRLVVEYRRDGERRRRRLLMASDRFSYGPTAFENAIAILREKGIPVEGVGRGTRVERDGSVEAS